MLMLVGEVAIVVGVVAVGVDGRMVGAVEVVPVSAEPDEEED